MQKYFTDMLLDSDRMARYCEGIFACVSSFKNAEGRDPTVLDVGCGTGLLTACALVSGAAHVISVDVNPTHTEQLITRIGPEYAGRVTPMHISADNNPFLDLTPKPHLAFDILVSEMIGTFSNGEGAFLYLSQYAKHMRKHSSGVVYAVPHRVVQTFRLCKLPQHVRYELLNNFKREYLPTELIGWLFENEEPEYLAAPTVVRIDDFSTFPFSCELPRIQLQAGTYVAEWEAQLWPNTLPLCNTWRWHCCHTADSHSKHARARAWGLMCFYVAESATVNHASAFVNSCNETSPPMLSRHRTQKYTITASGAEDERLDAVRLANPSESTVEENISIQDILDQKLMSLSENSTYVGTDLTTMYLSSRILATGIPEIFPLDILHRCTLGAIISAFHNESVSGQWLNTLDFAACFPLISICERESARDVEIKFIPPDDITTKPYLWFVTGAGFLIDRATGW